MRRRVKDTNCKPARITIPSSEVLDRLCPLAGPRPRVRPLHLFVMPVSVRVRAAAETLTSQYYRVGCHDVSLVCHRSILHETTVLLTSRRRHWQVRGQANVCDVEVGLSATGANIDLTSYRNHSLDSSTDHVRAVIAGNRRSSLCVFVSGSCMHNANPTLIKLSKPGLWL